MCIKLRNFIIPNYTKYDQTHTNEQESVNTRSMIRIEIYSLLRMFVCLYVLTSWKYRIKHLNQSLNICTQKVFKYE